MECDADPFKQLDPPSREPLGSIRRHRAGLEGKAGPRGDGDARVVERWNE
jgi:hypothetical protein